MSSKADNFFVLHVPGDYDNLLETRRKTEFMATLLKYNQSLQVNFSDNIQVAIKGGNTTSFSWATDPKAADGGVCKGKKIVVAPGLDRNTTPNIQAPVAVPTIQSDPYGNARSNRAPVKSRAAVQIPGSGGRGRGGGGGGGPPPGPQVERCKALYDFDPENDDELGFQTGTVIEIVEKSGEWWKGTLNGKTGIFPANFVEVIAGGGGAPRGGMGGAPRARGGGMPRGGGGGMPRGGGGAPRGRGMPMMGGPPPRGMPMRGRGG